MKNMKRRVTAFCYDGKCGGPLFITLLFCRELWLALESEVVKQICLVPFQQDIFYRTDFLFTNSMIQKVTVYVIG